MNPLMALLLNQQSGIPTTTGGINGNAGMEGASEFPDGYNVTGSRPGASVNTEEGLSLNNARSVMDREADIKETESASGRRGMFGMKGTLRDVIGLLGDAFLVQSGNNPMYAPTRQRERISDAQAGFSQGGQEALNAAERVGYYDPAYGRDLLKEAQTAASKDRELEIQKQRLANATAQEQRAWYKESSARISQTYAAALQEGSPEAMAEALRLARNESKVSGLSLEQLGVTPEMTEEGMRVLAGRGATVSQTMRFPLEEARVAQGQIRLDIQRGQLGVAQQRANTAAQALGLRRDSEEWNQFMDYVGIGERAAKGATDARSNRPRSVPGAKPATANQPSVSNW